MVGPWKREDIRSLKQLCEDALRLEAAPAPESMNGGLLGAMLNPPNPYPDTPSVLAALRPHPIYQWFRKNLPRGFALLPPDSPLAEVQLIQLSTRYMVLGWALPHIAKAPSRTRPERAAVAALKAIEKTAQHLEQGTFELDAEQSQVLAALLERAKPKRIEGPGSRVQYPALYGLAYALYQRLGIADTSLLQTVAAYIAPDCDARTVERYVKEARESS